MTLREALEIAKDSAIPGAITKDGKSYVWVNDGIPIEDRPYSYIPDIDSPVNETYHLQPDQLDIVLFEKLDIWIPVSNYIF